MECQEDTSPVRPNDKGEDTEGIRWMTYVELGRHLGIDPASAKRRAFRALWRRVPGNDGKTRVAVPATISSDARTHQQSSSIHPGDEVDGRGDSLALLIEAHAAEIERIAAIHRAELERLAAIHRDAMGRLDAELQRARDDLAHEREGRRMEGERTAAERQQLTEALTAALTPWWRKLIPRKLP